MFGKTRKKVLLVEPDDFLADIYKKNLVMEGFEVIVVGSRERAIKTAENKKPDVIVMEIILRDTDGFTAMEELKKNQKTQNIPVIFLTKLGSKEDVLRAKSLGAVGFIIKQHFRPSEVVDKIKKVVVD